MLVRVRLPQGVAAGRNKTRIVPLTFLAAGLLKMAAVSCLLLALWRLTNDMGMTGEFFIQNGLFSHWQVWLAITLGLAILAFRLARYSHPPETLAVVIHNTEVLQTAAAEAEAEKPELARRSVTR